MDTMNEKALTVYDNDETNDSFGVAYQRLGKKNIPMIQIHVGSCFITVSLESASKMLNKASSKVTNLCRDILGK